MKRRFFLKSLATTALIGLIPKALLAKDKPPINSSLTDEKSEHTYKLSEIFCRRKNNGNLYYLKGKFKKDFHKKIYNAKIPVYYNVVPTYLPLYTRWHDKRQSYSEQIKLEYKKVYTESEINTFLDKIVASCKRGRGGFVEYGKNPALIYLCKTKFETEFTVTAYFDFNDYKRNYTLSKWHKKIVASI